MLTILIIVLVVLALGGGGYGYREGWYGRGPAGGTPGYSGLGLLPILLVIVVLLLLFDPGLLHGV